jgi:hypothetical protein
VGDDRNVTKVLALFNWQVFKVCLNLGHENYFPSEASRYQALPLSTIWYCRGQFHQPHVVILPFGVDMD